MAWSALAASAAEAEEPEPRKLALGLSASLLVASGESCQRDVDVVTCSGVAPFAGADLSVRYRLIDLFGLGVRLGLAKDLDGSEGASSGGPTFDPTDQWLVRVVGEARLDPPLLPDGLWLAGELGLALLDESAESLDASNRVIEDSAARAALVLGVSVGWDLLIDEVIALTPEVRASFLTLGDPEELRPGTETHDYDASPWIELGLRFSVLP